MDEKKPARASGTKTVEEWARERGHMNADRTRPFAAGDDRAWMFLATKASHSWPDGKEMSGDDYDAAVKAALTARIR